MDLVADAAPSPDPSFLAQLEDTTVTTTTTTTAKNNSTDQAPNGPSSDLSFPSSTGTPQPSKLDASPYQLVFGIEDTSSEASLTGDSPMVNNDPSSQVFPTSSSSSSTSRSPRLQAQRLGEGEGVGAEWQEPSESEPSSGAALVVDSIKTRVSGVTAATATTATASTAFLASTTSVEGTAESSSTTAESASTPTAESTTAESALGVKGGVASTTATTELLYSSPHHQHNGDISNGSDSPHSTSSPLPPAELAKTATTTAATTTAAAAATAATVAAGAGAGEELVGSCSPAESPEEILNNDGTKDSGSEDTPTSPLPYSPVLNTSGDEDAEQPPVSPTSPTMPPIPTDGDGEEEEPPPVMSVLFTGITYLGSSSVDAPISEIEANRKMHVLREQSESTETIHIILSVPLSNHGSVILRDAKTDQPLATHPIKLILFCARGNAEMLLDCFCLNVKNRRSGLYQCHVFRCDSLEACDKIFKAIGKAFTTKTVDPSLTPLTGDHIRRDFVVCLDIHEEDGKGYFSPVPMDKDYFKLRQNTKKKVTISVSQPQSSERPLVITRCFGLLISPGRDVKVSNMDLLDNMNPSSKAGTSFSVTGIWDTGLPGLASLNEETPKSMRFQYLTVAADLILESVTEPVRFRREVKVQVSKGGMSYTLMTQLLKKRQGPMDQMKYTLLLKKSPDSGRQWSMYLVEELKPSAEMQHPATPTELKRLNSEEGSGHTPSPTQRTKKQNSFRGGKGGGGGGGGVSTTASSIKSQDDQDDSNEEDDDTVLSGWGDEKPELREDLLKDWGEMLDRWDGKDRARPSKVIKLCRKGIPRDLRCQVWQMLTGAAHDPQLTEAYRLLLSKESPAENVINWDIKRTYVGHDYFQEPANREALYKISKAYSVYDEEVGYCQGFSFMAAVLLLQKMPEETAFSVLVKIMYSYGHRNIFKANFRDLHLMFYQLDRLLEEVIPDLYQHLQSNRIETHMFASQWFLTLYTAKFPLSIVFRILDIYLCERIGVIFQVALALLKIARKELLMLDFEGILNYFRVSLPKKFQSDEDCQLLFNIMLTFKVNEKKLSKLQKDYQSYLEQQAQLEDPVMRLERDNKGLRDTIHRLEQENDNLAQDLVSSKIRLRAEMDKLEERIDSLSKEARAHKCSHETSQSTIADLREELKQAKEEFQRVMMKLTEERQQHEAAVVEYKQLFKKLDDGHQKQKEELSQELIEVKARLGSTGQSTDSPTSRSSPSSLSSEQRLRNLELELAQTKLALVESQCKNQELEHKIVELTAAKSKKWYDMDFVHKKK